MAKIFLTVAAIDRIATDASNYLGLSMDNDPDEKTEALYNAFLAELSAREGEVIPDAVIAQGGFPAVGMIKLSCGLVFQVNAQDFLMDLNAKGIEKPVNGLIMPLTKGNV